MRLLAVTDFHNVYDRVPDILSKAGKVDGTLLAGDLTHFGPSEKAKTLLGMLPKPVMAIPGNCDKKDIVNLLRSEDANLHECSMKLNDVTFIGIGGSNPTPFNTPFELEESEIRSKVEKLLESVTRPVVLLSHAPPKGAQDEIPGGIHVGSEAVAELAPNFIAIVCGHIHEGKGISKLGNTLVVNPGSASVGSAAIIDIDKSGNVKAELI
ncbi:metallophosphoesterase [Methanocella sp. CWC-04]|uniref:Metallophosphoesterase n=1 Tax=Methanooceanicella nereidis TaxID=2052831 RepID=A0AAP2RB50_9EURY|nr:metallophosphoesterase [Methanocella sp. CWC-04]MCD1293782.1 metallophosphoesterase [Methanocella sp. CWC-04]